MGGVRGTKIFKEKARESHSAALSSSLPLRWLPQQEFLQWLGARRLRPDEGAGKTEAILAQPDARWSQSSSLVELNVAHTVWPINIERSPQEVRVGRIQLGLEGVCQGPRNCVVQQDCLNCY